MMFDKPEVLAPVGSFESLVAAVRSGADAVYFGHTEFSARRNAENFTFDTMKEAVKYCHINEVKAYLTLNIAVKDSEIQAALNVAKQAYLCGIDGLIVSDLGLARLIRLKFPEIKLHASTQMSVNSPSALKILKNAGFCRIVPAREMSKAELISLCKEAKKLDMEVEVFVHGALCMCLSGQCLLSSVLGARSGNRGLCAGPCRLPFSVKNGTGYDLSLKDLSLLEHINELENMGVTSLKIEGRMKRPEYTAAAVSACRSAVDNGKTDEKLNTVLRNVFSRSGFTDGYFTDNLGKDMFGIRTADDAEKSKETYAFLHSLYRGERQKIPLDIKVCIMENEPMELIFSAGGFTASVLGEAPQPAKSIPASKQSVSDMLSKLGGTPYFAENITVELGENLFVSNREINELRRKTAERLGELYSEIPPKKVYEKDAEIYDILHNKTPEIYAEFYNISEIPQNLKDINLLIIPLEKSGENLPVDIKKAVKMPRFTENEELIRARLRKAKQNGINTAFCGTLSAISLAKEESFEVVGDIGLNVLNEHTADVLAGLQISGITLSAEMSVKCVSHFKARVKKGIFAYGRLPLMAFKNCPLKNGRSCKDCDKNGFITDRTETKFPIVCRGNFSEMLNSKPLYLADKLNGIKNTDFIILSFTTEKSKEAEEIIRQYKSGGAPKGDFTRGLYFKEVL